MRTLWVAVTGGVVVLDAHELTLAGRIETGEGPHDIAFSDDHRLAFVTNRGSDTVSLIDVGSLSKRRDVATGPGPALGGLLAFWPRRPTSAMPATAPSPCSTRTACAPACRPSAAWARSARRPADAWYSP